MAEIGIIENPIPKEYGGASGTTCICYGTKQKELSQSLLYLQELLFLYHCAKQEQPIIIKNLVQRIKNKNIFPNQQSGEWMEHLDQQNQTQEPDAAGQQITAVLDETIKWKMDNKRF